MTRTATSGIESQIDICNFCSNALCVTPKGDTRDVAIRWCNTPNYVKVAIVDKAGNEKAHMRVVLDFVRTKDQGDKGVDRGHFDCMAITEAVSNVVRANKTEEKAKAATKEVDVKTEVSCPDKEVTGSCPNEECRYKPGLCCKGQKDTGL
jgi:hypothetical protein